MSGNHPLNDAEALAVLEWYRAAGVDIAVGDEPVDRFADARPPRRPSGRCRRRRRCTDCPRPIVPLTVEPRRDASDRRSGGDARGAARGDGGV